MDKLERYSLNELVDVRDGTHDSPKYVEDGFPLITSKNLINGSVDFENINFISEPDYNSINKRSKVDEGDILYSMIGTIGNFAIVNFEPRFAIKNVALIKFKNSTLNSKYFVHYIKSNEFTSQIEKQTKGGTQKFVTLKILRNIQVPVPQLPQQQKIANILDAADTLRQNDKALVAKYDELTSALFLDMFGDPVSNPKGWEKVELKKLCSFKKKSIKPEDILEGENYVALDSIEKVTGNITTVYNVNKGELKSNKFCFDNSYILYGKLRPYLNKVALPDFKGICSTDIIPIQPINKKSNRLFITAILRHNSFVAFADERSSGANLPRISPSEVEKYSTINPPIELQTQFAERVDLIEEQKAIAQASLIKSEELFNSLLQKAFKGELCH